MEGVPLTRPQLIFPEITRKVADDNLSNMIKYLFNYSFYKFGIEISLIVMVTVIGHRMDMIALIYVFWLGLIFCVGRRLKSRLWPSLKLFVLVLTMTQYLIVVGYPPFMCIGKSYILVYCM